MFNVSTALAAIGRKKWAAWRRLMRFATRATRKRSANGLRGSGSPGGDIANHAASRCRVRQGVSASPRYAPVVFCHAFTSAALR